MARKKTEDVKPWKARRKRDYTIKVEDPKFRGSPNLYGSAHGKLRKEKGPASAQTCVDCKEPATRWTLNPRRGVEIFVDPVDLPFSCDPADYQARCDEHAAPHTKKVRAAILKRAAKTSQGRSS
jgi:hypothetical protein